MKYQLLTIIFSLLLLESKSQTCPYTESDAKTYFETHRQTLDPIEGIWSSNFVKKEYNKGELIRVVNKPNNNFTYIIREDDHFCSCLYDENTHILKHDSIIVTFVKTAINGLYLYKKIQNIKGQPIVKSNAILTGQTLLEYNYTVSYEAIKAAKWNHIQTTNSYGEDVTTDADREQYIRDEEIIVSFKLAKVYPTDNSSSNSSPNAGTGTGFAITSNGIICTNSHVVDGAQSIKVKGINGDFNKSYYAKVLINDAHNDLALIKIEDNTFKSLSTIPYVVKNSASKVGENVFALGYPLQSVMGSEIKLTNGIISSNSGFKGDITSYQISVPLQPGNSGGPLFDNIGNVIGIVNSKLTGGENVSYAIKSTYLLNLIQSLSDVPLLPNNNLLKGKALSDQVSVVKSFVYIIEVN